MEDEAVIGGGLEGIDDKQPTSGLVCYNREWLGSWPNPWSHLSLEAISTNERTHF